MLQKEYKTTTASTATDAPTCKVVISGVPRKFLVHFRKPLVDDPWGSVSEQVQNFGFDWLRDEYIHDIVSVLENNNEPTRLYRGDIDKLKKEYTHLWFDDPQPVEVLSRIKTCGVDEYIPSWLAVFAEKHKPEGVTHTHAKLHLQIDQEAVDMDRPLAKDGTVLIFTPSDDGVEIYFRDKSRDKNILKVPLEIFLEKGQLIRPLGKDTSIKYYADPTKQLTIKVKTPSDKVRHILVTAKHNNHSRDVGVLLIYPNHEIPAAHIQVVQFAMIPNSYAMPELRYQDRLRSEAFGQALINLTFESKVFNMRLHEKIHTRHHQREIEEFLKKYECRKTRTNSYPNLLAFNNTPIDRQNRSNFDLDVRQLFEQLYPNTALQSSAIYGHWTESNQNKTTHLIFTDVKPVTMNVAVPTCEPDETGKIPSTEYIHSDSSVTGAIGGVVTPRPFTEDEISCGCFAGIPNDKLLNQADYVSGNTAIIYAVAQNDIYAIFHELGHSFGLPHTFDKPPELDKLKASKGHLDESHAKAILNHFPTYQFYQGYTDNVMDYEGRIPSSKTQRDKEAPEYPTVNEYSGKMNSLFKWQWNILRADRSLTIPKNKEL
ncbi:hypothetical protein [Moraxella bovis]|uniref:hypothetical protein n=1 Tax=Moraxella bovis TaxID=476 RepID=UPI002226426B|nr:hypothetical protein [Moraxella bovis]UZA08113.1 hypothetical protein LP108_09780 [Moraxella bovis]UZA35084.1 hypothetical protein LP098_12360 [Moraxella bovis]